MDDEERRPLLFFVFYVSRSGFSSMLIVDLFVYYVAIDSCTNFVFMYLVPICRWFLHYLMEKSRLLLFYREKAEKTWGKTGQNGGRGDSFCSA